MAEQQAEAAAKAEKKALQDEINAFKNVDEEEKTFAGGDNTHLEDDFM